jgi:hypothetical protein
MYTLTNDDMDRIGYQVWDATEEIMEEETRKASRTTTKSAGSTGNTPTDVGSNEHHQRAQD